MKWIQTVSLGLLVLGAQSTAWAEDKIYIVRFKDNAVPQVKSGSVRDERVQAEPERWAHVGDRVLSHVQQLEKRHKFKADAAFGHVFQGMAVRLTPTQREALQRDPSVDRIEEEQVFSVQPLGKVTGGATVSTQTIPWGISKTGATQSYTLAGNGSGSVAGVRAYIIDTGLDTKNADLNRMGHINFTGDGRNIDCNGHGTHVAGTIAAYDTNAAVVGMGPGVALYGVKVLNCQGSGTNHLGDPGRGLGGGQRHQARRGQYEPGRRRQPVAGRCSAQRRGQGHLLLDCGRQLGRLSMHQLARAYWRRQHAGGVGDGGHRQQRCRSFIQ